MARSLPLFAWLSTQPPDASAHVTLLAGADEVSPVIPRQRAPRARRLSGLRAPDVQAAAIAFLRERYPQKVAEHVAADTGMKAATIAKTLERGSGFKALAFLLFTLAYGPDFLCAVIPPGKVPAWLDRIRRAEEAADLDARIAALKARRAKVLS